MEIGETLYVHLYFVRVYQSPDKQRSRSAGLCGDGRIKCRVLYISHSCVDTFEQVTTRCRNKTIRTMDADFMVSYRGDRVISVGASKSGRCPGLLPICRYTDRRRRARRRARSRSYVVVITTLVFVTSTSVRLFR